MGVVESDASLIYITKLRVTQFHTDWMSNIIEFDYWCFNRREKV